MSDLDKIDTDIKDPVATKACGRFGLSCSYCKWSALHPSPQESDWTSEDWDGTKAKTKDLLTDSNVPKLQTDIDQKMDVDELALSKL